MLPQVGAYRLYAPSLLHMYLIEEGPPEKVRRRISDGEGPNEKIRRRTSEGKGPKEKIRRRRSDGEGPTMKVAAGKEGSLQNQPWP